MLADTSGMVGDVVCRWWRQRWRPRLAGRSCGAWRSWRSSCVSIAGPAVTISTADCAVITSAVISIPALLTQPHHHQPHQRWPSLPSSTQTWKTHQPVSKARISRVARRAHRCLPSHNSPLHSLSSLTSTSWGLLTNQLTLYFLFVAKNADYQHNSLLAGRQSGPVRN